MANADYESVLCVKNQVHVYKIPPRPSNRGYRAADWNLEKPDWTGRLRVVSKGKDLFIKLEDKVSGELFAQCPVESFPGVAVEAVMDSSRYFVIRLKDDGGRSAFIGIGFEDRGDSFDLNVALQDHFKWLKNEENAKKAADELAKGPKLDLGFKEGQTIKINIAGTKKEGSTSKPRPKGNSMGGFLPPPPGGVAKFPAPPGGASSQASPAQPPGGSVQSLPIQQQTVSSSSQNSSNLDLLNFDFDASATASASTNSSNVPLQPSQTSSDPWGEFTGASSSSDWVQF